MSRDSKKTIKAGRLSGFFKGNAVRWMLRDLLKREPRLTLTQCRRVFSAAYQALRKGKPGAERLYERAKKEVES